MDQRPIVLYLARKGLAEVVIDENLVATLGAMAMSHSSITRNLREAKFVTSNPELTFLNRYMKMMIATRLFRSPSMNNHLRQSGN
jgi:hypothetical protein